MRVQIISYALPVATQRKQKRSELGLTLHNLGQRLTSDLCILYLDDVTIRGNLEHIMSDLGIIEGAVSLGLFLNNEKSEIITTSTSLCPHSSLSYWVLILLHHPKQPFWAHR